MGSFRNQRQIFLQIAAEVASQNTGLDKWHLPDAQVLLQQWVLHGFLFPLLIGGDDEPASGIGELDGPALALPEVFRADLPPIDQRDRQSVGNPGAELLHEVERQGRPVRAFRVEEADERVEPDRGERRDAVVTHEGVEETEEAVDPVARRASRPGGEAKALALLFQEKAEDAEVLLAGEPFAAAQGVERAFACEVAGGQAAQFAQLPRHRVRHSAQARLFLRILGLARGPEERVPAVLDLARNDLPGHRRAFRRNIRGAEMGAPQGDAGIRHSGDPRLEVAALAEVIHGHAVLPAEVEHRCRERDARSEGADRFEMMDGNGKLPPIRRVLPRALLGRQLGRIDRHFHLEGQMVARDKRGRRREVESVLDDVALEIAGSGGFKKAAHRPVQSWRMAGQLRQAHLVERALRALRFQHRRRHGIAGKERMHLRRRLLGEGAKFRRELHLAPPFARRVKDGPALHGTREHFFEAKRLGAKLHVVILELPPLALLIFHRDERSAGMLLDDVALPAEPEPLGPDRERAEQRDAFGELVAGQVRVLVREIADERVDIRPPQPLDDLQPRPPIAEEEVVEQAER